MNWTASRAAKLLALGLLIVLWDASPANKGAEAQSCSVLINGGLGEPQPLVLRPGKGGGFAYPAYTGRNSIELSTGRSLRLVCLGSHLNSNKLSKVSDVEATCVAGTTFELQGRRKKDFKDITCTSYPKSTARRMNRACPKGSGELCEIGFDLGTDDFQTLILACHDPVVHNTRYAYQQILSVIGAAQKGFERKDFAKGNFYDGIPMANIYTRATQRNTLAEILGSKTIVDRYIPKNGSFYLIRGHLAGKADFIYGTQQRATFYYLNAVPMWQNINGGNWFALETNIRKLATQRETDLHVVTGSIGVLKLADPRGNLKEFYLYDPNGKKAIPVPKFLFKVVWVERTGLGAAFITVNNPYLKKLDAEHTLCKDVSSQIKYLTWKPTQSNIGLSYSCKVEDFRKVFPDLPNFKTTGLLV